MIGWRGWVVDRGGDGNRTGVACIRILIYVHMGIAAERGTGPADCFQTQPVHFFDFRNSLAPDDEQFVLQSEPVASVWMHFRCFHCAVQFLRPIVLTSLFGFCLRQRRYQRPPAPFSYRSQQGMPTSYRILQVWLPLRMDSLKATAGGRSNGGPTGRRREWRRWKRRVGLRLCRFCLHPRPAPRPQPRKPFQHSES